jgi:type IV pilus assembly protein PilO
MADVARSRTKIVSVIAILAAIDVAALVYLALPLRAGAAQPAQVQQQAEEEYRQLSRTTVPLRGIDQKLSRAQKEDALFIERRLPSRYSDVVAELGKVAAANHIRITAVSYSPAPGTLPDVENLEMRAGLAGPYVNVVKFMNALERDKMFFIIESVGLTGQSGQAGQRTGEVRLDMKLGTYLRSEVSGTTRAEGGVQSEPPSVTGGT